MELHSENFTIEPSVRIPELAADPSQQMRKGIAPRLLLSQVRNTVPFLFEEWERSDLAPTYGQFLQRAERHLERHPELEGFEDAAFYYELCLSAHHATVSSFVPTDVDIHIRFKQWHGAANVETKLAFADTIVGSLDWDYTAMSRRWLRGPLDKNAVMSGHYGEWFSTASAAYAALRRDAPDRAMEIADMILAEVNREARLFKEWRQSGNGIATLQCATLIAHNLGDLDRVIDLWNLPADDYLRMRVYKAGHAEEKRFGGELLQAGELNKAYMAKENHRHFALRKPKCIRRAANLMLPLAPFLDDWGALVARHPSLTPEDVAEVVEALIDGWQRLSETVGYARALAGILENFPGGFNVLAKALPAKHARTLKAGPLRSLCSIPQARFEAQWQQFPQKFLRRP